MSTKFEKLQKELIKEISGKVKEYKELHNARFVDLTKESAEVVVYEPDESYEEWTYQIFRIEKLYSTMVAGVIEEYEDHYDHSVPLKDLGLDTLVSLYESIE